MTYTSTVKAFFLTMLQFNQSIFSTQVLNHSKKEENCTIIIAVGCDNGLSRP